jgi:hypothetical protein
MAAFAGTPLGNGRERFKETLVASVELQNTLRQAIVACGPVRPGRRVEADAYAQMSPRCSHNVIPKHVLCELVVLPLVVDDELEQPRASPS